MKAVVAAFNQEKALVGAFSMLTKLWMDVGDGDRDGDTGTPATGIHYTATSHLCSADSEHYIVTNLYTDCLYQRDVSTDKLPTKA